MRQQVTIIIGTSVDTDYWSFEENKKESYVKGYLESSITDLIQDATAGKDDEAYVEFVEFEYGELL